MSNQSDKPVVVRSILRFGSLLVDCRRRVVVVGNKVRNLSAPYFNGLLLLIEKRPEVVSKAELEQALQVSADSLPKAIELIRKAIGDTAQTKKFIVSERGVGYRFIGQETAFESIEGRRPTGSQRETESPISFRGRRRYWVAVFACLCLVAAFLFRPRMPDPKLVGGTRVTYSTRSKVSPLLTDGRWLYFGEVDNGQYRIVRAAASGSQVTALPISVPNAELCDLSQDGMSLLVRSLTGSRDDEAPVYVYHLADGTSQQVGELTAFDVAWLPDGRRILYTRGGSIYRTDTTGRESEKIVTAPGKVYWIRSSPDGTRIRFTVLDPKAEATSIWEARANGGHPQRLFSDWPITKQPSCGSWTPDGKYFVFQVRQSNTFQIWAAREETNLLLKASRTPTQLTSGPVNYRAPVLGKDGIRLFARTEVLKSELVRVNEDSDDSTPFLPNVSVRTAGFSADGNWIAYGSLVDNNLWRCRVDGSECRALTSGLQQAAMPRWSPDGSRIAFMGRYPGQRWGIFTVGASGDHLQQLSSSNLGEGDPDWSPDASRLVFGNVLEPKERMAIKILNLQNHQVSEIRGSQGYFSPRWSPDGRFLVAVHGDSRAIGIFSFSTSQWKEIPAAGAGYPNWSRSGVYVYFFSNNSGIRAVSRVELKNWKVERVVDLQSVQQGPFIFGTWIGLAQDDTPLAVRNLTTEDIFAWDFK